MKHGKLKDQRGFTLIEVLVAVTIMAFLIPSVMALLNLTSVKPKQRVAADQLSQVQTAAKEYIEANYATLQASATAAVSVAVPVATLQSGGYLPATFQATNPWNQTYTVYVTEPVADNLQGLVITSGGQGHTAGQPAFGNRIIPETAAMAGAVGGYFPTGDIPGQAAGVVQGAYGGWQFALAGTDIPSPGAGHLAALAYFSAASGSSTDDFLHRVDVAGKPELNTMTTTLHMGGNTIEMGDGNVGGGVGEGVGRLNFENHVATDYTCATADDSGGVHYDPAEGLYICRSGQKEVLADSGNSTLFQDASVVPTGTVIPKPACPTGAASNPEIYVSPATYHDNAFQVLRGVQTWAVDTGSDWTVNLQVLTPSGWTTPAAAAGKILVVTRCAN